MPRSLPLVLAGLLLATPAAAWEHTRTADGLPLVWPTSVIDLVVRPEGPPAQCEPDEAKRAAQECVDGDGWARPCAGTCWTHALFRALATWNAVECPDGPRAPRLRFAGWDDAVQVDYEADGDNDNAILWVLEPEGWGSSPNRDVGRAEQDLTKHSWHECGLQ